eukprot:scaffold4209_cov160-Ochromonas_danica.AAC.5
MELFSISTPILDIHESFGQEEMNDLFEWLADYEEDNVANDINEASTDSSGLSLVVSEKKSKKSNERKRVAKEICSDITSPTTSTSTSTAVDFTVGSDVNLAPRTKSRRDWRRVNPLPRILKRDIRRDFPTMMMNVFNSRDAQTVCTFFMNFSVGSCHMNSYLREEGQERPDFGKIPIRRLDGLNQILSVMSGCMGSCPDFAMRLKDAKIKQHLNRAGSQLVLTCRAQGTRVEDYMMELLDENQILRKIPVRLWDSLLMSGEKLETVLAAGGGLSFDALCSDMRTNSTNSYEVDIISVMTYWLDNDNRIYRLDMEGVARVEASCDVDMFIWIHRVAWDRQAVSSDRWASGLQSLLKLRSAKSQIRSSLKL